MNPATAVIAASWTRDFLTPVSRINCRRTSDPGSIALEKDWTFDPISRAASVPAIAAVAERKLKKAYSISKTQRK
jgi:hypothetical protein